MMYDLFIYALKASACTGILFLFYKMLLAKETYHRINRMVLLGGFAASFLLPLLVITITKVIPQEPVTNVVSEMIVTETSDTNQALVNKMTVENLLGLIYIAGIIAMILRLYKSIRHIMGIVRSGEQTRLEDGSVLVNTNQNIGAFSWLKYIVISRQEDACESRLIMMHEQGHIRMHHTYDLLLIDIIGAMQWFNPFMWMLRSELKNVHEFEADSYVLGKGVDAREYQLLLIKKAVGASRYSVANSFNHNKLKIRITMMLVKKSSKIARAKALLMLPLLCVGVMAFAETNYVYAVDKGSEKSVKTVKNDSLKVLYLVDGVKTESVDGIEASDIAGATILKGADAAVYGNYDQVVEITSKKGAKEITVHGIVKDAEGAEVIGAVAKVINGETKTVTDRSGRFTLKAKNTDVIAVSYSGYRDVNMMAKENMAFVLKERRTDEVYVDSAVVSLKVSEPTSESSSSSSSSSVTELNGKVTTIITQNLTKDNEDGSKKVISSISYDDEDNAIVIKNENNKPILVTRNGTNVKNHTVYVDGKKVDSLNDLQLQSDKILSIAVEDEGIFITLKKDGVKYPTQKEIVKSQKHLNGKGKKYYVTTHEGTTDVIRAKNDKEAIKYCETHYDKNVLLLKRPNGGVIKVVKPKK